MKVTKKIGVVMGAITLLGTAGTIAATVASATSTIVTASTSVSAHPDTTSGGLPGTACTASGNGPEWALDAYTSQMTAVPAGTGTWNVTIEDHGSFHGFADPATCDALTSSGPLLGLYHVTVTSANTPSAASLHSSYTGAVSTTQMVRDFFNDPAAAVGGGAYFFTYQNGAYVQAAGANGASYEGYGDVSATPPPALVKIPDVAGMSASKALATVRAAGFTAYTSPYRNPKYTYVATGTSPSGFAPAGSTVVVLVKQT